MNNRTNYRIYDQTGGGAIEDIYAATLDEAIEKGREWINAGDWDRDEYETPLECCVREIVYADLDTDGVYHRPYSADECDYRVDVDGDLIDSEGLMLGVAVGAIDEEATDDNESHDCSGVCAAADAPDCEDDEEHDWQSPHDVVGGLKDNPGVWSSGHGKFSITEVCSNCGIYRTTDCGASNPSNGQCVTRISYADADEKSLAWIEGLKSEADDAWDRQMQVDAESGKLDPLLAEAESDIAAGRVTPLNGKGQ